MGHDDLMFDPTDADDRELLARESYYRARSDTAAQDREHDLDPHTEYWCKAWEQLPKIAQDPYRAGVALVCDQLARGRVVVGT